MSTPEQPDEQYEPATTPTGGAPNPNPPIYDAPAPVEAPPGDPAEEYHPGWMGAENGGIGDGDGSGTLPGDGAGDGDGMGGGE